MTHYVGLAIVPADSYDINPDYDYSARGLDNMFEMGEAVTFKTDVLDDMLAPYWEQTEDNQYLKDYFDQNTFLSHLGENLIFHKKQVTLDMLDREILEMTKRIVEKKKKNREDIANDTGLFIEDENSGTEYMYKIIGTFEELMEKVKFNQADMNSEPFLMWLHDKFGGGYRYEANKNEYQKTFTWKDVYHHNPNARWDWYEVGGRWDKMLEGSNILVDLNEIFEKKEVEFWTTLPFYATSDINYKYKGVPQDNIVVKSWKENDWGQKLEDENGKWIPNEYYTAEELSEKVEVNKYGFNHIISEEHGWVAYEEMGSFAVGSNDHLTGERLQREKDRYDRQLKEVVDFYSAQKFENGLPKYVGVVVDFHI